MLHSWSSRRLLPPALAIALALAGCASNAPTRAPTVAPTAASAPATAAPSSTPALAAATSTVAPTATSGATTPLAQSRSEEYTVLVRDDPKLGKILTDSKGRTLYRFTRDSPNKSTCSGGCAQAWPPLTVSGTPTLADGVPGTLGVITRDGGSRQVTYNGAPLYYYAKDSQPGDTTGQGVGGVWFVVMPGSASAGGSGGYQKSGY